jgi:hypothetical protein
MKKILVTSLILTLAVVSFPGGEVIASSPSTVSVDINHTTINKTTKKKRKKSYGKPRKKKFLGIFKRKSACDCPKH